MAQQRMKKSPKIKGEGMICCHCILMGMLSRKKVTQDQKDACIFFYIFFVVIRRNYGRDQHAMIGNYFFICPNLFYTSVEKGVSTTFYNLP